MKKISSIFLMLLNFNLVAQEILSLKQAIKTAVESSNLLKLATNNLNLADLNQTKEAAGFAPTVNLGASNTFFLNSVKNELADGRLIQGDNAASNNTLLSAQASFMLFEGNRKNNTLAFNKTSYMAASSELKNQINQVISKTVELYVLAWQSFKLYQQNQKLLELAKERAILAKNRYEAGLSSKIDFLQTQIEIKQQEASLIVLELQLSNTKTELLNHLQLNQETQFTFQDSIVLKTMPMNENNSTENPYIKRLIYEKNQAEWSLKTAKSSQSPTLAFNLAYNYARNQNEVGFLLLSQNYGPQANLTFNWNIYDRGSVKRSIKSSNISLENARIAVEQAKLDIELSIKTAKNNLESSSKAFSLHQDAYNLAQEAYQLSTERYKNGKITIFELNQSQAILAVSMQNSINSLTNNLLAQAKILLETSQIESLME